MTSQVSNPIEDASAYNGRMARSLMDKIFFADKIETDCIVDFGCADGALLKALSPWVPGAALIGIDNDSAMIQLARENLKDCKPHSRIDFFSDMKQGLLCSQILKAEGLIKNATLNLSSVIHEIYNYSSVDEIQRFWNDLWKTENGFAFWDYIVIRDMSASKTIDRPSYPDDIAKVYQKFLHTAEFNDFESIWGSVENNRNLVHFLLKYKYMKPNWRREVRENYFPIYREQLLSLIPSCYRIVYHEHYVLPYIQRTVESDFGINLKDPTHIKIILQKNMI
jgi:hypothetical protein